MADQAVVGKTGRVTGEIAPGNIGEVMLPVRGGAEAFHAYAIDRTEVIATGSNVLVIEYHPPRTVVVSPI